MRKMDSQRAFTLIELMIALTIITIVVATGVYTYVSQLPVIRIRGDVRELIEVHELAKMRAIATGIPHGVGYWRGADMDGDGETEDMFFVFMDCAQQGGKGPDYVYTDADNDNPADNTPLEALAPPNNEISRCSPDTTNPLTYDPLVQEVNIMDFSRGVRYTYILGETGTSNLKFGANREYVCFTPIGQAVRGQGNLVNGTILIQNDNEVDGDVDQTGITLIGATGIVELMPLGQAPVWNP